MIEAIDFIHVEAEGENAIREGVLLGGEPLVDHHAIIDARCEAGHAAGSRKRGAWLACRR